MEYCMKLHKNKKLFKQAVQYTADEMKIPAIYIEKDYWVSFALYTISKSKIGEDVVFKGGTALSKCYEIIERFSEDIDLVIIRREGESDNNLKSKLKKVSEILVLTLTEIEIKEITNKKGQIRKTVHTYNKYFKGNFGQVRDVIVLETTWLGKSEPYNTKSIISYVGKMMIDNGNKDIAEEYGLIPFTMKVLDPKRTICEKIMSLVRFSYGENPIENLKQKIRHTYDLHKLLNQKEFIDYFNSYDFEIMLLEVAKNDLVSFKNNNKWLEYHPNEALLFKNLDEIWGRLSVVYNEEFSNLVYGELPNQNDVLKTLKMIKLRLSQIGWDLS